MKPPQSSKSSISRSSCCHRKQARIEWVGTIEQVFSFFDLFNNAFVHLRLIATCATSILRTIDYARNSLYISIRFTPTFRCKMLQVRSTTQDGTSPKPEPISARLALATEGADLRMLKNCIDFFPLAHPTHSGTQRGHLTFEYIWIFSHRFCIGCKRIQNDSPQVVRPPGIWPLCNLKLQSPGMTCEVFSAKLHWNAIQKSIARAGSTSVLRHFLPHSVSVYDYSWENLIWRLLCHWSFYLSMSQHESVWICIFCTTPTTPETFLHFPLFFPWIKKISSYAGCLLFFSDMAVLCRAKSHPTFTFIKVPQSSRFLSPELPGSQVVFAVLPHPLAAKTCSHTAVRDRHLKPPATMQAWSVKVGHFGHIPRLQGVPHKIDLSALQHPKPWASIRVKQSLSDAATGYSEVFHSC